MYFQKRVGEPEGKAKSEGAHPPRPAGPGFRGRQRLAAGTRAGHGARPGRARPQARLIFMSGREAPLLHGRPAGPRRPPPAFVPFPPPAVLPRSAHAGAAPTPTPGARRGSLRPRASAGRGGPGWREGREPAASPALPFHPPGGAAPGRPKQKIKQTRTGESAASRSAPGRPVPGRHARRAPDPAGGRAGAARRRRAPRPPPPAGRSQAPPRPAPAGPGLSAAAGGRGAGRRPPDSPLASPGRAGAALGRPRSPSDRSASLRCRAELFPGGGFLASSSLDPPPPTPPPSPPLPRGGSGAEYFLS